MKKTKKRYIGDIGEEIASKYLINRGFSVIGRNYLKPWGEIDIIAQKGGKLHFVEVKTVSRESFRPEENMHRKKVARLNRAIQTYLLEKKVPQAMQWEIILACVYLDNSTRRATVELFENAIL